MGYRIAKSEYFTRHETTTIYNVQVSYSWAAQPRKWGTMPPPPLVGPAGTGGTGGGPMKMIFASAADSLYSVLYK